MPLSERTFRHVDSTRSPTAVASVEQFLRATGGGESYRGSPTNSPTSSSSISPYFDKLKHHDPEDDHGLYQKKSVLAKVKERAKKFRNSLSKRRMEDENVTPSWGVSLEDDEKEEEDAEYLGAPMYESELAPEGYKENARQHPRADPVICEKHVLHNTMKLGVEQDREKSRGHMNPRSTTITQPAMSSKTQSVVSTTSPAANNTYSQTQSTSLQSAKNNAYQKSASSRDNKMMNKSEQRDGARNMPTLQKSVSSSASMMSGKYNITSQKGGQRKDYYSLNKSEPRGDAKTVSEARSDPNTTTCSNSGVIEKVKGTVNSLIGSEEPSQQYGVKTPTIRNSSQTPQVEQEENHGRILQAN